MTIPIVLYASQVATAIGCNRHKRPSDALELMWERLCPESFRASMARNGIETDADAIARLTASHAGVRDLIRDTDVTYDNSTDVSTNYDAAFRNLTNLDGLTPDDRKLVDSAVKRALFTNYGTAAEHTTLEYIQAELGIAAVPDDTFYKQSLGHVEGVEVSVGGKIDAISEDGKLVLEIKNRIRRLFIRVPFYEIIQVQTYLQLLDVNKGAVVEAFTPTDGPKYLNIVPVSRDRVMWDTIIVPKLRAFVRVFLDVIASPASQDAYWKSPRRHATVQAAIQARLRQD